MDTGPDDRMYDCLPMYHAVGGVVAIGALLVRGGSVVIAREILGARSSGTTSSPGTARCSNISASCAAIWSMRRRIRASARIGCGSACGNGLRADVWEKFQSRFAIPHILEFYAATEGNVSLYNVEGKAGAIGRVPPFLDHRFPLALVKFDAETGEPLRDADGRCIRCADRRNRRSDRPNPRAARREPAAPSRATPTPPTPSAKSCAMSSKTAMPGIAPAI